MENSATLFTEGEILHHKLQHNLALPRSVKMTLQTEILKMLEHYNSYAFKNYIITRHVVIDLGNTYSIYPNWVADNEAEKVIDKIEDSSNAIIGIIERKQMPTYYRFIDLEGNAFIIAKKSEYDFRKMLKHLNIQGMLKSHNQHYLYASGIDDQGNEIKLYFK